MAAGKITKTPCEVCGATEVEMHHEDYGAPLEVNMLCKKHHIEADQRRRDESARVRDKGATPSVRTSIKPMSDRPTMKRVSMWLPESIIESVKRIAKRNASRGWTQSDVYRAALADWVEGQDLDPRDEGKAR